MRCREIAQGNNCAHPGDAVSHPQPLLIALAAAVRRGGVRHHALRSFPRRGFGCNFRNGSNADPTTATSDFRSTSETGLNLDIAPCPKSANKKHWGGTISFQLARSTIQARKSVGSAMLRIRLPILSGHAPIKIQGFFHVGGGAIPLFQGFGEG